MSTKFSYILQLTLTVGSRKWNKFWHFFLQIEATNWSIEARKARTVHTVEARTKMWNCATSQMSRRERVNELINETRSRRDEGYVDRLFSLVWATGNRRRQTKVQERAKGRQKVSTR
jgi:hypothetical protein